MLTLVESMAIVHTSTLLLLLLIHFIHLLKYVRVLVGEREIYSHSIVVFCVGVSVAALSHIILSRLHAR